MKNLAVLKLAIPSLAPLLFAMATAAAIDRVVHHSVILDSMSPAFVPTGLSSGHRTRR